MAYSNRNFLGIYRVRSEGGTPELVRANVASAVGIAVFGSTVYWADSRLEKVFSSMKYVIGLADKRGFLWTKLITSLSVIRTKLLLCFCQQLWLPVFLTLEMS